MSEEIRFFLPGPTYVADEVRHAMTRQPIGHRSAAFKELYGSVSRRLPDVFRTSEEVMTVTGSGSLCWDLAVASTMRGRVLCFTNGAFSERFLTVCRGHGVDVEQVEVPWGEPISPDLVRRHLRAGGPWAGVTLAHNETSTGVLSPLEQIAQVVREESDALLYVDAVSSLAGARVEAEAWGIDFLFTGAQKSMALPPGLAFFTVSGRLLERAEATPNRGYYTDLVRWRTKHLGSSTLTTPAVSQVFALDVQLNRMLEEGMEARWQRHLALRARTEEWAASRGFRYASQADGASPTVSCLEPPAGVEAPKLVAALAARDLVIGTGYGTWKPKTIRIGHMGEVRMDDLETLLAAIDEVVEEIRA